MRKLAFQLGDDVQEARPRSRVPGILLGLLLVVGLGPLALEGGAICLGHWRDYMGVNGQVKTPVLDQLQEVMQSTNESLWLEASPYLRRLPWDPKMVLPAATIVMAMAMFMLRR